MSRRWEAAIAALLVQPTVEAAAAEVGVTPKTLASWMAQEDFRTACKQARMKILEQTVGRLVQTTVDAVDGLRARLTAARDADALRAIALVLQYAHKGVELSDLSEDLAALQEQVQEILHYGSTQASRRAAERSGTAAAPAAGNGASGRVGGAGGPPSNARD
jgi:hypothetical protein